MRSGRAPSTGASVPVELGCTTSFPAHSYVRPTWKLSNPHCLGLPWRFRYVGMIWSLVIDKYYTLQLPPISRSWSESWIGLKVPLIMLLSFLVTSPNSEAANAPQTPVISLTYKKTLLSLQDTKGLEVLCQDPGTKAKHTWYITVSQCSVNFAYYINNFGVYGAKNKDLMHCFFILKPK